MKMLQTIAALLLCAFSTYGQQLIFPVAPSAPTVRFFGTTAATSRYFWVVARYPWGISAPSLSAGITNGSATLSTTNTINAIWATLTGATGYDLLKTATNVSPTGACNCALVVNTTTPAYNDIGAASLTYTVAAPGLVFSDATAQTTAAAGVGGATTAKLASVNDVSNNLAVVSISGSASAVNNVQVADATTTNPPVISAIGSDTNIDLKLSPKGTGIVNIPGVVYSSTLTITTANLNTPASNTIVADVAGRTLTPVGFFLQALGGNTSGCTLVELQDSAAVLIMSEAIAGLVANQGITESSAVANLSFGAGWMTGLTAGKGIQIVKTGGACATATSFVATVFYTIS